MAKVMAGRRTNTQEHMDMLHALRVGSKHTEETKAKISASKQGQPSAFKGREHTAKAKAKNAAAHIGLMVGSKHPQWDESISTDEIVAMLKSGMTKVQIAAKLGKSPTFVHRRLAPLRAAGDAMKTTPEARASVDQSHFHRRTGATHHAYRADISNDAVEELRAKGLSTRAIAVELGCSETMVRGRLGL
jgi:DNA-binding CsgD family transcriptional regulator